RGLAIAIESGRPEKVLAWGERLRANALRLPAVRPPADKRLRELQTELRRVSVNGHTGDQARLEAAIRTRARVVDGSGAGLASLPDRRDAAHLLGGRALVEFVELEGVLRALTLHEGHLMLHEIGAAATAASELDWLRFACGRLAAGRMASEQRAATVGNAA